MNSTPRRFDRMGAGRLVATFGGAQLLRLNNGHHEIRGGFAADHTDVKEWISLFLHEAAVSLPPTSALRTRLSGFAPRNPKPTVHRRN
jgi:hypothetical protein